MAANRLYKKGAEMSRFLNICYASKPLLGSAWMGAYRMPSQYLKSEGFQPFSLCGFAPLRESSKPL